MTIASAAPLPPQRRRWSLRAASDADAASLAVLAERTFRDAFHRDNTIADMDLHCARSYAPALQRAELRDPRLHTLVAECEGALIAYAQLCSDASAPAVGAARAPVELRRFYVLQDHHGSGLAAALMAAVLDRTRELEGDLLWLGVWERNARAIRFYSKHGFRQLGEQTFVLGSDPQRDLVMARRLGPTTVATDGEPRAADSDHLLEA